METLTYPIVISKMRKKLTDYNLCEIILTVGVRMVYNFVDTQTRKRKEKYYGR